MSTSIVILSPLPEARTAKAVADCLARAETLKLQAPMLEVLEAHPRPEELEEMLDEDDVELRERLSAVASVIAIHSETSLTQDPTFVECLRFLLRRCGAALVQFPDGIAEVEIAAALIANLQGIDSFDERDEARRVHARLLQIKYRLLSERWKTGDEAWAPRALSNHVIEQHERSARLTFPPEFRAYLAIVGVGPGPSKSGILPLDEIDKPKTYAKTAKRPKLGKTVQVGKEGEEHFHILVCDGEAVGSVWEVVDGQVSAEPIADSFTSYIDAWIGVDEPEPLPCPGCGIPLEVQDLEREFCQGCGLRRSADTDRSEASHAFEALAKGLLLQLLEAELLEIEDPSLFAPLVAALTEYMSEKGHKWKSPDRAAASIAGWLLHRDEVAELHGSNSDVARVFVAVGSAS